MKIELSSQSESKIEDILEQMYTRYSMENLTAEELIDALLDLGIDLMIVEDISMPRIRDRLLDYCTQKVNA